MNSNDKLAKAILLRINEARNVRGITWSETIRKLKVLGVKCNEKSPYSWNAGKSTSFLECMPQLCKVLEIPTQDIEDIVSGYFTNSSINNSFNVSQNSSLNIGSNLSKQESEIINIYRSFSIEDQQKFVNRLLEIKKNSK